jgi:hypothetical protein
VSARNGRRQSVDKEVSLVTFVLADERHEKVFLFLFWSRQGIFRSSLARWMVPKLL